MTYFEKLHPWCIIRPLPKLQRRTVARFRRRNDAEAHLQLINRLIPSVTHTIIFDPTPEQQNSEKISDRSVSEEIEESSLQFFRTQPEGSWIQKK